jgi:DNA polymerase III subunit beta
VKIRLERDALADALSWVATAAPSKPATPVLAGVKLTATDTALRLGAYDYETAATADVDALVDEPGQALVSARLFAAIVKELPKGKAVTLSVDGARLSVKAGTGVFGLPLMPVEDYPALPAMPDQIGEVDAAAWSAAVKRVAVTASRDDAIPEFTSVLIEVGEALVLAATDRYRLATTELAWQPVLGTTGRESYSVSAAALAGASFTAGMVGLHVSDDSGVIGFSTSARTLMTRLMPTAGWSSKWRGLLPVQFSAEPTVNAAALEGMLRRVAVFAGADSSRESANVSLAFADNTLTVQAGGADDGEGAESIEIGYEHDPLTVTFKIAFLREALKATGGEMVELALTDERRPAVLRPVDPDGEMADRYLHLVMPIRPPALRAVA